jgi:hypothetical protein
MDLSKYTMVFQALSKRLGITEIMVITQRDGSYCTTMIFPEILAFSLFIKYIPFGKPTTLKK